VYPAAGSRTPHALEFLAGHFNLLEIASTFRKPLRPEVAQMWVSKVSHNPAFQFTAVAPRRVTHDRDLDAAWIERFKSGLRPLVRAKRFGCLVFQFPWAFRFTVENREFLIRLRRAFHELPMVAEFRHASWLADEALGALIDYRLGFVNLDQPPYTGAMPPSALVTAGVAYVRLHGRDSGYWPREFRGEDGLNDYLYSPQELAAWKGRIEHIRAHAGSAFVVTANAAGGKSVINALQLMGLLAGRSSPERAAA
jgi:uncharacterized protein YecE (DUF72 family)